MTVTQLRPKTISFQMLIHYSQTNKTFDTTL